jgi:hypothetical protein
MSGGGTPSDDTSAWRGASMCRCGRGVHMIGLYRAQEVGRASAGAERPSMAIAAGVLIGKS